MENSDPKHQKILEAVRKLLARKGYAGTTISLVAAEAGVSRGLLHYYFKNKEEMLANVIQTNMEASVILMADIFAQSESVESLASALTRALRHILETDPDFFNLFFEGWAVARQSALVDSQLKSLYSRFRDAIYHGLNNAVDRGAIAPTIELKGLAALLTGIIDGLGLQLITEPQLIRDENIWQATEDGIRMVLTAD
jgi:AcrR family transcriptional regulator